MVKSFKDAGQATPLDRLYSLQQFHAQLCMHLSNLDVKVLLEFLARHEGVLLLDAKHSVIKWRPNANPQAAIDPVTDTEVGIVHLRSAKEQLESHIVQLESRIQECVSCSLTVICWSAHHCAASQTTAAHFGCSIKEANGAGQDAPPPQERHAGPPCQAPGISINAGVSLARC